MPGDLVHLFERPLLRPRVARMIHDEFWRDVPGASAQKMAERLAHAVNPDALPLCLVALQGDLPIGVINLVDNDDAQHGDWHPWLAGLVVDAGHRAQGVGTMLVRALLARARRLGYPTVYFGTESPGFYARLGALVHLQPRPGFWFMRFDLTPAP